ncbi:hypothetical protein EDB85DRAFT_1985110, partial [Lactarius pseudohatsudake]
SPVRMQLDEKDAEERPAKDPENKLRDQFAALEARVAQLRARGAAPRPKKTAMATASVSPPPHPDSRTSTVYALPHRRPLPAREYHRSQTDSMAIHLPTASTDVPTT